MHHVISKENRGERIVGQSDIEMENREPYSIDSDEADDESERATSDASYVRSRKVHSSDAASKRKKPNVNRHVDQQR